MSTTHDEPASNDDDLQFDHADYDHATEAPKTPCKGCQKEIEQQYYVINGAMMCEACKEGVENYFKSGSKVGRFIKAGILGGLAALVGTILYVIFLSISPVDISIVAILIGLMVGKMVRKGSENRGGFVYQVMAVLLTYLAMSMTYFTRGVIDFIQNPPAAGANAPVAQAPANPGQPPAPAGPQDAPAPGAEPLANQAPLTAAEIAQVLIGLILFALVVPFYIAKDSPIYILFFLFALWEAWKLTARLPLFIQGPLSLKKSDPNGLPEYA